jgi:hypothetical protein
MAIRLDADILSIIVLAVTMAAAFQIMLTPYANFKNFFQLTNGVPFSNIDVDEYNAGIFLLRTFKNEDKNTELISDYASSYIMRGMTGLNTSASRHPTMTVGDWKNMQEDIRNVFGQRLNETSYKTLDKMVRDVAASTVYLMLSKRTCWWLTQENLESIRFLPLPNDYTFEAYCTHIANKFDSSNAFQSIYENEGVRIYKYLQE